MIRTSVGDNQLTAWADELAQLDEQIADLQTAKRDFYAGIRDNHGKVTADALKAAVKIIGMDPEKRAKAEEIDAETERFVQVLSKPRAPRATRTREIIEESPAGERAVEPADAGHHSAGHVSPSARNHHQGSGSANIGGDHVNPADDTNTDRNAPVLTGKASLAAREGEKSLHFNSGALQ